MIFLLPHSAPNQRDPKWCVNAFQDNQGNAKHGKMPKYTHSAFYERGSLRSWCFISSAWNVKITLSTLNDMTRKLQPLWWNGNNDMLRGWECSEENNNETVFLNLLLRPHQPGCRCHLPSRNLWQTPSRRTPELLKWKTSMIWGFKHHKNSNLMKSNFVYCYWARQN